eukprot:COSAG02_NODE_10831_length_1849_cov_2.648000_1_plen_480_part_01
MRGGTASGGGRGRFVTYTGEGVGLAVGNPGQGKGLCKAFPNTHRGRVRGVGLPSRARAALGCRLTSLRDHRQRHIERMARRNKGRRGVEPQGAAAQGLNVTEPTFPLPLGLSDLEPEPEAEPEPQPDGVEALFAEFAREDAFNATAKHVGAANDSEDAIIGFIADSIVAFDDELEALRQGGPGALREHALQEALSDCQKNDRKLRLQELRLRRFCEQVGADLDAPDKQLAACLGMLEQRRQLQLTKLRENEVHEHKLLLSRREAELAAALQRAEAAELALQVERESQARARIATTTACDNDQPSRVAPVGKSAGEGMEQLADGSAVLSTADVQSDNSPRAIVERLRMEKLVGGSSDPAIKSLQDTLGRALEKLSRDLYSSSDHFFSEVVQNCDDNDYPEGIVPTLHVVHTPSAIFIANNEIGFSAADVTGLCNIGAGTKVRDSVERVRIGRKGIGFKSVFMATECPHICSGGFCWRFDTA